MEFLLLRRVSRLKRLLAISPCPGLRRPRRGGRPPTGAHAAPPRAALREEMLDFMGALNEIIARLGGASPPRPRRWPTPSSGFPAMGRHRGSPPEAMPGRHMPAAMHEMGRSLHRLADEFAGTAPQGDLAASSSGPAAGDRQASPATSVTASVDQPGTTMGEVKAVLAYSGGLDTSVILKWLQDAYLAAGGHLHRRPQPGQELEPARAKALKARHQGEEHLHRRPAREFVRDFVFPMFRCSTIYEGEYLLGTSIARPLIAKRLVEIARKTRADAISHAPPAKATTRCASSSAPTP